MQGNNLDPTKMDPKVLKEIWKYNVRCLEYRKLLVVREGYKSIEIRIRRDICKKRFYNYFMLVVDGIMVDVGTINELDRLFKKNTSLRGHRRLWRKALTKLYEVYPDARG